MVLSRVRELVGRPRVRQQCAPLRPPDGVNGSVLSSADSPNVGKVLPLHEGFVKENPKTFVTTWNSHTDAQTGSTQIANNHPL